MSKINLSRAARIKTQAGELRALKIAEHGKWAISPWNDLSRLLLPGATKLAFYWADPRFWFQDVAGTIPVTAPGQPIRRWVSVAPGTPALVQPTNADFAPVSRRWPKTGRFNLLNALTEIPTVGGSWGVTGGTMVNGLLTENTANSAHNTFSLGSNNAWSPNLPIGTRVHLSMWVKAVGDTTTAQIAFGATNFGTGSFANFDLVTGDVAATGCNASMVPEDGGWRLLADAVTTATASAGAAFALCLTNNNFAAGRVPAYAGSGRQLEWGKVQISLSEHPYQRVASVNDITEAGVTDVWSAFFDGVGDWLQSEVAVDLTASGQLSLFAGAKKLSDAAQGTLAELSINAPSASYTGSFILRAPQTAGGNDFMIYNRGATGSQNSQAIGLPAPLPAVISGLSDLSDVARIRANGTLRTTTAAVFGGGNYRSDILYVGRRAGSTLPFNGMLQSLIIRGGDLPDNATVIETETIINDVWGAY